MLPSIPFDGVPRGRSLNTSVVGSVSIPTGGLMSAAPGGSVMGPGLSVPPTASVTATGSGQLSSNIIKSGNLIGAEEEVRTLFVSGLPMDVRLRELYLLFRCYDGYEGSFLKLISSKPGKPPQPIAFVSFKLRKQAEKALSELQGVRFDPVSSQTLRLEFARTNSRVSPKQQQQQPQQQQQQHQQQAAQQLQQQQQPHYHQYQQHHHAPQHHQQQLSPHALHSSHSHASQQHMTAIALGQNPSSATSQGYVDTYSAPSKNTSSCYYFMPNTMASLHAHPNAAAQGLYNIPDNWSRVHLPLGYNSMSHVSTPSPTLSPAPSTSHLSVLNILSDTDSSAAPSPTPDNLILAASSSSSSLTCGTNSAAIAPPMTSIADFIASSSHPTSSLVITNFDKNYSEDEVDNIFEASQGFLKAKVHYSGGQLFALVNFKDADSACEALESFQDMSRSSSNSNRPSGLMIHYARQRSTAEISDDGPLHNSHTSVISQSPSTAMPIKMSTPIGQPVLSNIGSSGIIGTSSAVVGSGTGVKNTNNADSISIPPRLSIPVQFQNGNVDMGGIPGIDLSQQMSELELNVQQCPSPIPSLANLGSFPSGITSRPGYVDFSATHLGNAGGYAGQNFTGPQLMFSDNYPQGTVFLNNYSNPISWQYNHNGNPSIK